MCTLWTSTRRRGRISFLPSFPGAVKKKNLQMGLSHCMFSNIAPQHIFHLYKCQFKHIWKRSGSVWKPCLACFLFTKVMMAIVGKSHNLIKRRLRCVYCDASSQVIGIIGKDAFVGHFFDNNLKPFAPIPESICIMGFLKDASKLFKCRAPASVSFFQSLQKLNQFA